MIRDEFDYVVVGGGSAGCVVAGRLSEDPALEVALVEAGPSDSNPAIQVPARFWEQQKSTLDWDFESEPEPALNGRRTYLPRGRVLGGTSSMNTMLYVRGAPEDYDSWARAGCEGWWFKDLLPLFKLSEDNQRGESHYHGAGGPLRVEDPEVPALLSHWVAGAEEAGHPRNEDFNGETQDGVGVYQATQRDGRRVQQLDRLHRPQPRAAEPDRPHLHPGAAAAMDRRPGLGGGDRPLWRDRVRPRRSRGDPRRRRLSLAAAVDALGDRAGRSPARDGDRAGARQPRRRREPPGPPRLLPQLPGAAAEGWGEGWIEAGGFARTDGGPLPDVQFHAAAGSFADEGVSTGRAPMLSFGPYVTRPKSRGLVRLRSPLPQAKPRIQHNFLSEPDDVEVLRRGVRMAMAIAASPSVREVLADPAEAIAAGELPGSDSHAAIEAHMRATAFSFYHPVGTCAMGSVVDSEMRVMGVEGVRVCDTSIMPNLTVGNTNAPAIMFGEKLAAMLGAETTEGVVS